jgi:UDP-GlcNAc:undecaprenyl-phosphate GlcNAc-1-phosphate transferase
MNIFPEGTKELFFLPFLLAGILSYFFTALVIKFAARLGIIDDPKNKKHPKVIHTYPVPRGGGIPIFLALLLTASTMLPMDKHITGIIIGALILTVMGFLDDKHDLNPYLRLFLGILAASVPVFFGIGISFVTNPLGGIIDLGSPWFLSEVIAILWITFLMNIVNMGAKGVDGQMSGVTVIAGISIAAISLGFSADITQWPVIILAAITAGAYSGFLPWHIYPQKIMPGYGGSTLAGYLLAIASILSTAKVGVLMVVLGVPLIDTGYTIVRRILTGKSPVWGDRGHLHHRLLDAGLSKHQVALFYWIITLILGVLAINLNTASKLYTMIGIAAILGAAILFLTRKSNLKN